MANYKPKICKRCGTEFTPKSANGKYCTSECAKLAKRERGHESLS